MTADRGLADLVDDVFAERSPGVFHATDAAGKTLLRTRCVGADMPFPGWMRLTLEPDRVSGLSSVWWWQVPSCAGVVRWLPADR